MKNDPGWACEPVEGRVHRASLPIHRHRVHPQEPSSTPQRLRISAVHTKSMIYPQLKYKRYYYHDV